MTIASLESRIVLDTMLCNQYPFSTHPGAEGYVVGYPSGGGHNRALARYLFSPYEKGNCDVTT